MLLDVVFENSQLVVINKPSGLLVHRSSIDAHETRFALQLLRDQLQQHLYPVHRLDKPTSGLLMFAKTPEYASLLSQAFAEQRIKKSYLAIVRGYTAKELWIDHALKPISDDKRKKYLVKPAQNAQTQLFTLAQCELDICIDKYPKSRYSLVLLEPETGRKHQLRRHMKHISHPMIGDPKYGKSKHNHYFAKQLNCPRLLLAATQLQINLAGAEPLDLHCHPGAAFTQLIKTLPWVWSNHRQAQYYQQSIINGL